MLESPDINDIHTTALIEAISFILKKIALEAAWPHVADQTLQQLCQNVAADPAQWSWPTSIMPTSIPPSRSNASTPLIQSISASAMIAMWDTPTSCFKNSWFSV
jgi:hypothetical protein